MVSWFLAALDGVPFSSICENGFFASSGWVLASLLVAVCLGGNSGFLGLLMQSIGNEACFVYSGSNRGVSVEMKCNRSQVGVIVCTFVLMAVVLAFPPYYDNSGLFGSVRYIPVWKSIDWPNELSLDWWVIQLEVALLVELGFALCLVVRRPLSPSQIGSLAVISGSLLLILIGYAFDYSNLFEPDATLLLLNVVGIAFVVTALIFGSRSA